MRGALLWVVGVMTLVPPAWAQNPDAPASTPSTSTATATASKPQTPRAAECGDPDLALQRADNAFAYRDFGSVTRILQPCLHPLQIVGDRDTRRARRLHGISLHIVGRIDAARGEFGALLQMEPDLKLDPFVVPPGVIETFEEVRRQMKPVLDKLRNPDPVKPPEPKAELVEAPPPLLAAFVPVGYLQFAELDQPTWGAIWSITQVLGLAINVAGFFMARNATVNVRDPSLNDPNRDRGRTLMYSGAGLIGASWTGQVIQGLISRSAHIDALSAQTETRAVGPRPIGFTLSFPLE